MDSDHKKMFAGAVRPLTVYLGESGKAHDTRRVDILPSQFRGPGRKIVVSVDTEAVAIIDVSGPEEPRTLWRMEYDNLPE